MVDPTQLNHISEGGNLSPDQLCPPHSLSNNSAGMRSGSICPLILALLQVLPRSATVKLGAIFRNRLDEHLDFAFRFAVNDINEGLFRDEGHPYKLDEKIIYSQNGNSLDVYRHVCELAKGDVMAIIGPPDYEMSAQIEEICDALEIPYLKIVWDHSRLAKPNSLSLTLTPDMNAYVRALEDLISYWKWKELLLVYEDSSSLLRYQKLFGSARMDKVILGTIRVEDGDFMAAMKAILKSDRTHLLVDVNNRNLDRFFMAALQYGMINIKYDYLLTSLDLSYLNLSMYSHNHVRITAFKAIKVSDRDDFMHRVHNNWRNDHYFPATEIALISDAIRVFAIGYLNASSVLPNIGQKTNAKCNLSFTKQPFKDGSTLRNYLSFVRTKGLTGDIQFKNAKRFGVKYEILQLGYDGELEEIGSWDASRQLVKTRNGTHDIFIMNDNRTLQVNKMKPFLRVTTIAERPYVMLKKDWQKHTGNDRFEGFCIDLLERIAKDLSFSYEINLVKDEYYGSYENGSWNGMVGEILRGEADISVAPLTVNYKRAGQVDFTKPFLSLGISILFKIPQSQQAGLFSFMNPMSYDIWLYILVAAILVTIVMYATARLSPYEWVEPRHRCNCALKRNGGQVELRNWFKFSNTIWYTISTLLKGGCDFGPKAVSTRLLGGAWWIFTLVLISAYTANLAAVLTVERRYISIKSMEDLANQSEISYGVMKLGSTMQFFNESKIPTHQRMWKYMQKNMDKVKVDNNSHGVQKVLSENYAYLMESNSLEYEVAMNCNLTQIGNVLGSKGYGIATRKQSEWTEKLSRTILDFGERGIIELLKTKWWKNKGANCQATAASMKQRLSLTMENVAGLFVVLIIGLVLAVIIVFFEFCIKSRENAEIANQSLCSEMGKELWFAVSLNKSSQRHAYTRRCSTCNQLNNLPASPYVPTTTALQEKFANGAQSSAGVDESGAGATAQHNQSGLWMSQSSQLHRRASSRIDLTVQ